MPNEHLLQRIFEYLHWFRMPTIHKEMFEIYTFKVYDDVSCISTNDRYVTYKIEKNSLKVNVFDMQTINGILLIQNSREYLV
jgi:hypothetical protein